MSHGLNQTMGGELLSMFHLSQVIASRCSSGRWRTASGARLPLVIAGLAGAAGGVLCSIGASMARSLSTAVLLMGLAIGVFTLVPIIAAADFGAENVGRVYGLFTLIMPVMTFASFGIGRFQGGPRAATRSAFVSFPRSCLVSVAVALFVRARSRANPAATAEAQAGDQSRRVARPARAGSD